MGAFDDLIPRGGAASRGGLFDDLLPQNQPGNFRRGLNESFQQLPQLGYGLMAGAGAAAESAFGEGGIATGVKQAGLEGYQRWGDKISAGAKPTDDWDYSYEQAKQGNLGALADWLTHGLGYVGGQAAQMLATAGIGAVGGKFVAGTAAKQLAEGMATKEAAKLAAANAGMGAAEVQALAVRNVAEKFGRIGAAATMGAAGTGQEGGEIFGGLVEDADKAGRTLTGSELGKAFASTLAAGGLEFVGDKLGLDILMGKSRLFKPAASMTGLTGRLARGGVAAMAATPIEAGTEYLQTGIEEYGKGAEASPFAWQQSPEAQRQAQNAAALGALGGAGISVGGGLMSRARAMEQQRTDAERRLAEADNVSDMIDAAQDLALTPLAPVVPMAEPLSPRAAAADTIAEIRQLDPAQQSEAMDLLGTAGNMQAPGHVRRFAQNRLDELLRPFREIPTGEATEMLPVGEAVELTTASENERRAADTLARWMSKAEPVDEARARQMVASAAEMGHGDFSVVPHTAGGFTVVPKAWLPEGMAERLMAERRDSEWEGGRIPVGEAADLIPTGEALEDLPRKSSRIPVGEATEIEAEAVEPAAEILPDDLLTADAQPYGTKAAAAVRAKREGGGSVVEVPGGFVVRKEDTSEPVADMGGTAAVPVAAADGRSADVGGSIPDARPDSSGGGGRGGRAAEPGGSGVPAVAVGAGGQPDAALSDDTIDPFKLDKRELNRRLDAIVAADEAPDLIRAFLVLRRKYERATGKKSIPPPGSGIPLLSDEPAARFPKVATITDVTVGPGGTITPSPIAAGRPLFRETDNGGLDDLLRLDGQAQARQMFVTDNRDLAIGQGENRGVMVTFRPDALSGREHRKPGAGAGREYQTDLAAPRAVQSVEMAAAAVRSLRMLTRRALADFDRTDLGGGRVRFDRKRLPQIGAVAAPAAPLKERVNAKRTGATEGDRRAAVRGPDRRQDSARRKRVAEMTPDELRAALHTDDLTGLRNRRWLDENEGNYSHVVAFDADSLKWVNDNLGHESGDRLLRAWGEALRAATDTGARSGGDEFFALAHSQAEGEQIAARVAEFMRGVQIDAATPHGETVTLTGPGGSFGVGESRSEADQRLNEHKQARQERGERAGRGEQPPGVVRHAAPAAQGEQDHADQAAEREGDRVGEGQASPQEAPKPAAPATPEAAPVSHETPAAPKAKRPPKSFRKKVKVTTPVFVEESASFESREIDADAALKALDEDVSEMERFLACLKG